MRQFCIVFRGGHNIMAKICMFAANYLPHVGGIENYTYHLSKELISMGHSVTVVTSNLYDNLAHECSEKIDVYRMPCYSLIGDRYPVCKINKEFKKIEEKLRKYKFDLIVIHARFYIHSIYAARFACKQGIRCITIEHGTSHLSMNNMLLDFGVRIWEHGITAVLKRYCKHFYGACKLSCEWSKHFGINSEGVLSNAVDIEDIRLKMNWSVFNYRKEYNISDNDLVICYTGRIIPEKGIMQLIMAFNELRLLNSYLFVAGDGPMLSELMKEKNDRVIFLGAIDYAHVISLLKDSDIFCLPSVSEALSTSILEAIATNTLVITTKRGGATELLTDRSYGIIMESNSVEEIKEAILNALDKNYRLRCTGKAYTRLVETISWRNTAQSIMKIIDLQGEIVEENNCIALIDEIENKVSREEIVANKVDMWNNLAEQYLPLIIHEKFCPGQTEKSF